MAKKQTKQSGFQFKILLRKVLKNCVYVLMAGLASVYGDNPAYLALTPLLIGLENWAKNRKK
jgi:hypothetical protein